MGYIKEIICELQDRGVDPFGLSPQELAELNERIQEEKIYEEKLNQSKTKNDDYSNKKQF